MRLDHLLRACDLSLDLGDRLVKFGVLLDVQGALGILLLLLIVLNNRLFLQLADMARHPFEIGLKLRDLRIGLKQVLRVQITIRSDLLIQVKLQLELSLGLQIFLLELRDQVVLELDLLETLVVLGVGRSGLFGIDFLVFLELDVLLTQLLHANGVGLLLESNLSELLLIHLNFVFGLPFSLFLRYQVSVEQLPLVDLRVDLLLLVLDVPLLVLLKRYLLFHLTVPLLPLEPMVFLFVFRLMSLSLDGVLLLGQLFQLLDSCV